MKRLIGATILAFAALGLVGCGSLDLKDEGRYDSYIAGTLQLATAAQQTETARIQALAAIALNGADDRTRDRIVAELGIRSTDQGGPGSNKLAAPQAPTNMLLEGMRILGPGSLGLLSQGIAAWNQNQADILATERAIAQQQSVEGIITNAINSNTGLGLRGMEITGDLAGQSINRIPVAPPSVRVEISAAPSAPAAE